MPLPPARHDALFRQLVSDPGRAAALLRDDLPPEVRERLDPDHAPEHIEGTAIDGDGRATQADAIFRVRMKDGASATVYALLEHLCRIRHKCSNAAKILMPRFRCQPLAALGFRVRKTRH